jgi:AmiR/NasT family two-component response regulator
MDDQHQSDIQQLRDEITRPLAQVANMEAALASRDIIGQAKGIIMVTKHCDADAAFELLAAQSQAEHRKLVEVADEIVAHVSRRTTPS